jgi:signal transduction histidine kinase
MQYPAVITISNTVGDIGVPEEDKVFTKYYRSEKAHKYTGSGLGLYLVSSIAKLLKGEVMYLHNPQLHTVTFKLILPIKQ